MNELALFAGAGGGILGGKLLGWRTVCAVEIEPYPIGVLIQRQNDGILSPFPIWDDIFSFDGKPWRGIVDIISGGFPCQPFSTATHGNPTAVDLWPQMRRVLNEVRPYLVFGENVSTKAIARAAKECECDGYISKVLDLSSGDVGADYPGHRSWFLAAQTDLCSEFFSQFNVQTQGMRELHPCIWSSEPEDAPRTVAEADARHGLGPERESQRSREAGRGRQKISVCSGGSPTSKSSRPRMADGVADWMDRYFVLGNGQVPAVAATAFLILTNQFRGEFNGK